MTSDLKTRVVATNQAELAQARRRSRLGTGGKYVLLVVVLLVMIAPYYWLVTSALKPSEQIYRYPLVWFPTELAWSNFVDAWTTAPFGRFFVNSIIVSGVGTLLELLFALLCAYAFAYLAFPYKRVLFIVLLGGMMVPGHVALIPNYVTISALGWTDTYAGLIAPGLASVFGTFLLRQHMLTLPRELLDAATVDGAGHLRTLFTIVAPLSRPMLVTVGVVTLVTKWNDYIWPLIVVNSTSMRTVPIGLALLKAEEGVSQWGPIMAGTVLAVVPILVVYLFAQRQLIAGFTEGAVR